ncbi:MAG: efflux RND transporter periplasmic adaptor subunit [Flavobacteriaceae bacterium]|nr:efflux RND transporter periplasmic adaptor subunit [Flavobacteriaceae bacterium]
MKKYTFKLAFIALSLVMLNCGSKDKSASKNNSDPISVVVGSVQSNESNQFITASGKIEATNSANLSTRMMGSVNKVYVNVGQKVSKGQLLISINNADLQAKRAQINATITEATAAYTNAKKDYDRFKNLFAENSASQKEMDDITTRYEMAKARLEGANQMKNEINSQFAYSNITAPFSGVVTNKFIEAGDMANPGMPLIAIESPGKFEVAAMVPENEISQIKSGTGVNVLVKSLHQTLKGKVTEVSTSAKNTGGQYLVKVKLDKTDTKILSGMFTTVQFPVENKSDKVSIILIPRSAIVTHGGLKGVFTVSEQNTALLRWVRLGRSFGDNIEVLSGLSAGEQYIISANGKLENGVNILLQ